MNYLVCFQKLGVFKLASSPDLEFHIFQTYARTLSFNIRVLELRCLYCVKCHELIITDMTKAPSFVNSPESGVLAGIGMAARLP